MKLLIIIPGILLTIALAGLGFTPSLQFDNNSVTSPLSAVHFGQLTFAIPTPHPTPNPAILFKKGPTSTPPPTPTPTTRPLTFAEMNAQWGPCANVPALFWHHVQDLGIAKQLGHAQLTVDVNIFRTQMQYVKDQGYTTIRPDQLTAFFDAGTPLPPKPILLTFDDGYDDFGSDAAPILHDLGLQATAFIPTGLLNNPGYMSWDTLGNIAGWGIIYFANHTWSHHSMSAASAVDDKEITTADTQLSQHNLNPAKIFAYPYGTANNNAIAILAKLGYKLAFTTSSGSVQCKAHRFILPRIRIGNASLSRYGL
jgi:peptidoglycan/xylan/chitin deacetylase (PgdA/CDA1 family)